MTHWTYDQPQSNWDDNYLFNVTYYLQWNKQIKLKNQNNYDIECDFHGPFYSYKNL